MHNTGWRNSRINIYGQNPRQGSPPGVRPFASCSLEPFPAKVRSIVGDLCRSVAGIYENYVFSWVLSIIFILRTAQKLKLQLPRV
jgi:hypothetical protein